ncbi:FAD-dependent oxidoreductase [Amycolatopsis jejuensis]|uniref:FAD-dependent oxidoreductase n=1 Tax=Amycolatopsis jejuensis TaxID=330084 RepID=UPI00052563A1|nr:FAD-dependent oxidoreductase [Amycolatopsis jejuensis]
MQTEVLIAGGGYAGLSTAMYLAQHGTQALLVERHETTSPHPKASGQTWRAMELYRFAGIDEEVRRASLRTRDDVLISTGTSLSGPLHRISSPGYDPDVRKATALRSSPAGQDAVEPILARRAAELGADVRFGVELVSFDQDDDGVRALIRDRSTGVETQVQAGYLVAADGARSPIRTRLGIPFDGEGGLHHMIGAVFDADPIEALPHHEYHICFLQNGELSGMVTNSERPGRYILGLTYDPARGESPDDFTTQRITDVIRELTGRTADIVGIAPWEIAAKVARTFRDKRIFLTGDAAKVAPPSGGQGGNTAVGDGNNLAWKLSAVLRGEAGEELLDTYEVERRPIAEAVVDLSMRNLSVLTDPVAGFAELTASAAAIKLVLGFQYRSSAVSNEDDDLSLTEDPGTPSGRPGFRAPDQTGQISHLLGNGWILLGRTGNWASAAEDCGITFRLLPDLDAAYRQATLVRPDGIVAWRSDSPHGKAAELRAVLDRLLSRT